MPLFRLTVICDSRDIPFGKALIDGLRGTGLRAGFPPGEPVLGRDGIVFVLSRNLVAYQPSLLTDLTTNPELIPFVVVTTDDTPVPLSVRDAPLFDARTQQITDLATALKEEFSRVLPVKGDALAIGSSPEVRDIRRAAPVFICYAKEDADEVDWLHHRLSVDGFTAWLDSRDLLPGQDWEYEIRRTIRRAAAVLICLSRSAVDKFGYVQKEISVALEIAAEAPEGRAFIIPIRLDDCEIPERLRRWQWAKGLGDESYVQIVATLDVILANASFRRSD